MARAAHRRCASSCSAVAHHSLGCHSVSGSAKVGLYVDPGPSVPDPVALDPPDLIVATHAHHDHPARLGEYGDAFPHAPVVMTHHTASLLELRGDPLLRACLKHRTTRLDMMRERAIGGWFSVFGRCHSPSISSVCSESTVGDGAAHRMAAGGRRMAGSQRAVDPAEIVPRQEASTTSTAGSHSRWKRVTTRGLYRKGMRGWSRRITSGRRCSPRSTKTTRN